MSDEPRSNQMPATHPAENKAIFGRLHAAVDKLGVLPAGGDDQR